MSWISFAEALLKEHVTQTSLIRHLRQVACCMRWYAVRFNQDIDLWESVGLLHDFDYEKHPESSPPDGHPYFAARLLKSLGFPEEGVEAILAHAKYTGVERKALISKVLFAVDELSGFIDACSRVHPSKSLEGLDADFILKRLKEKSFARNCNREDINEGAADLNLELKVHIENCLEALRDFYRLGHL